MSDMLLTLQQRKLYLMDKPHFFNNKKANYETWSQRN
jgi:hypothetical protein